MAKKVPLNTSKNTDNSPVVLLNDVSNKQDCKDYATWLNAQFNKEAIQEMVTAIRTAFLSCTIRNKQSPDSPIKLYKHVNEGGLSARKDFLCHFVSLVISDDENFAAYIAHLHPEEQQLWDLLFRRVYVSEAQAYAATGRHWLEHRKRAYSYRYTLTALSSATAFFGYTSYYYHWMPDEQPYMYMSDKMWQRYKRAVDRPRQEQLLQSQGIDTDALPSHLLRYSNEAGIGTQISTLRQMCDQKVVEFGSTKMSQATYKRVAKAISLPELFPNTKYKDEVCLEASVMVPSLAGFFGENPTRSIMAHWDTLRDCIGEMDWEMWLMEFFKHLRGARRDDMIYDTETVNIYNELIDALGKLPVGRWFSYDEIEVRRRHLDDSEMNSFVGLTSRHLAESKITHAFTDDRLRVEEAYEVLGRPMAGGFLVLFASLGLIDIAYHSAIEEGKESCWDCVDYVSLTPLGAYVFGQTDSYQSNVVIHSPHEYFAVDAERLIIRAIDHDGLNPYESLLSRIAAPIGSRRYHVTPETFMKGIAAESDIDAKERFFRDTVCADVPPVWQQFFADMRQRCFPLRLAGVGYRILRVANTDPAFLRILTTDAYIRAHTLRAEKSLLLIETKCYDKVLARIRSYGYLM